MKFTIKYKATEEILVRDVLQNKLFMSHALITRLKKSDDGLCVNGERITVRRVLKSGEELCVTITEDASQNIVSQKMELDIVYEDEYLLAVNKPADTPTHPSHLHYTGTLANGVIEYLNLDGQSHTIHIVTRLDRDTSGIVLFAKSSYIHDLMSKKLQSNKINKKYIAICEGIVPEQGRIEAPIERCGESIIKRCVGEGGVYALSEYKRIAENGKYSLVELTPHTGRTHQLRVHMSYIGHPIAGDDMYGANANKEDRHLLHCNKLIFDHPMYRKEIEILTELPLEFKGEKYKDLFS